jgi:serine/threonine-protein kinase HipA
LRGVGDQICRRLIHGEKKTGQATANDFIEFGKQIGVQEKRVKSLIEPFLEIHQSVVDLIDRSFLDDATKKTYLRHCQTKRNMLIK